MDFAGVPSRPAAKVNVAVRENWPALFTMATRAEIVAQALNTQREAFKGFLVSRVRNEADAEDILQAGLTKALRHAEDLREDDKVVAWFYRLLRRAVIDYYRAESAARQRDTAHAALLLSWEEGAEAPEVWSAHLCACLDSVISSLPPEQADLLRQVELQGVGVAEAAGRLQLTPNHASVVLHRARKRLRERLEAFCGACAEGACLDCHCAPVEKTSGSL